MSFVPGEQDQVVFRRRRMIGERELQLELVEEAEAGDGGVSHEGGVTELVGAAEPGAGYVDGCKIRTQITACLVHVWCLMVVMLFE